MENSIKIVIGSILTSIVYFLRWLGYCVTNIININDIRLYYRGM